MNVLVAITLVVTLSVPGLAGAADVDSVCGDVLSAPEQAAATPNQKLEYCKAAKSAQESMDTNAALWKVWAGVATVCSTACAASMIGGFYNQWVCIGATGVGGATDAVMTKELTQKFMAILMAGGMAGGSYMANKSLNGSDADLDVLEEQIKVAEEEIASGKDILKAKKKLEDLKSKKDSARKKDYGACLAAAGATLTSFMRYQSMKSDDENAKMNLDNASKLASTASALGGAQATLPPNATGDALAGSTQSTGGTTSGSNSQPTQLASNNSGCSVVRTGGSFNGFMQCATASDKTLPSFVSSPRFMDDFKRASGATFPDFVAQASHPAQSMGAAMGATFSLDQNQKLHAMLRGVDQYFEQSSGSGYASSGGGGGGHRGGDEPNLGDMMAKMMSQFMPGKEGEEKQPSGVTAVILANKKRSPAAIVNDPTLSIFDRVTYRYHFVSTRVLNNGDVH